MRGTSKPSPGDRDVADDWLKARLARHRPAITGVAVLRSLALLAHCLAFALFSYLLARLLEPQGAVSSAFIAEGQLAYRSAVLGLAAALLVALVFKVLAFYRQQTLQYACADQLESELDCALKAGQNALIRQHSSFYWQKLKTDQLHAVARYVSEFATQRQVAVILPLFLLVLIAWVNWFVCLILLLCLPVVPLFMIIIGKGTQHLQTRHFMAFERLGDIFSNRLENIALINIFSAQATQIERLQWYSQTLNARTLKVLQVAFLNQTVLDFFSTLSMALIAVYVGFTLLGEISLGPQLVFADGLFLLITTPMVFAELKQLGNLYHQKSAAQTAAELLAATLAEGQSPREASATADINWVNYTIANTPLHAEHLRLAQGQHVLLRAPSGYGKTLLFEALSKQRRASHYTQRSVALLNQSPCILRASVRDNLQHGRQIDEQRLLAVLQQVELLDWLNQLPDGLDSYLGEYPPLSGGEQQRLNLARLLLVDADIYLLDEPTAFLGHAQHLRLCAVIEQTLADKTVVWACHKPTTPGWFSHIWQIDAAGKISCDEK